jgi:hypothetical protein
VNGEGSPEPPVHLVHAGHVLGLAVHVFHVVDVDADVFGGDVAAAQRFDELAERAEQRFALVLRRVADDHGLAAADVQARHRVLVGHAAREAQHVVQRVGLGLVRPHARAAQRGAEHGVVDGDDGLQARILVVAEHDLLVAVGVEGFENHRGSGRRPFAHGGAWQAGPTNRGKSLRLLGAAGE